MMSKRLRTLDDVKTLASINGVPIAVLDDLCRPLPDRTKDPEHWRQRSSAGFLTGSSPSLIDVMMDDWIRVAGVLGTSHTHIADVLRTLLSRVERAGPEFVCEERCWFRPEVNPPVVLKLQRQRYNAPQWSPFGTLPMRINEKKDSADGKEHCWDEELIITNEALGLQMVVARGVIDFIDEIGFYEGGDDNPYRVDPLLLIATLTYAPGMVEPPHWLRAEAVERIKRIADSKVESMKQEARSVITEIRSNLRKEDAEDAEKWIDDFLAHTQAQQDQERAHWNTILQRLLK